MCVSLDSLRELYDGCVSSHRVPTSYAPLTVCADSLNARQLMNVRHNSPEMYNMTDLSENSTSGRQRRDDNAAELDTVYYIS